MTDVQDSSGVELTTEQERQLRDMPATKQLAEYDEELLSEIKRTGDKLIKTDSVVQYACGALLLSRQLYVLALGNLGGRLQELNHDGELGGGLEAYFVSSMARAGLKPFEIPELLKKIQGALLPWLAAVQASDHEREKRQRRGEQEAEEAQRQETMVPLGFLVAGKPGMPRKRTMSLLGHPGAIQHLLRATVEASRDTRLYTYDDPPTVLHLGRNPEPYRDATKGAKKQYIRIGFNQWRHSLTNAKKFDEMVRPWLRQLRDARVDMLLVDDFLELGRPETSTADLRKVAALAHRYLRNWATGRGCALLLGLPTLAEVTAADVTTDYESLEVYTDIKRIRISDGSYDADFGRETYNIHLNDELSLALADRRAVDHYEGQTSD